MSLSAIYKKLEKLRLVAERDCGNETQNAINLIEKLLDKYDIEDFQYDPWSKEKEKREKKERLARERAYKAQREAIQRYRISYTSLMRDVVIHLARCLNVRLVYAKGKTSKLYAECTPAEWWKFEKALLKCKAQWKHHIEQANTATKEWATFQF